MRPECDSDATCEDFISEAFLQAICYRGIAALEVAGESAVRRWMYTVVMNDIRDGWKRKENRLVRADWTVEPIASRKSTPEEALETPRGSSQQDC